MRSPAPLAIAALLAIGCSAGEDADPGPDGGGDDESGYDLGEGTGAGEDDGDGPDDDIPNEEDAIDTEPGLYDLAEPLEDADINDESGVPDVDDPAAPTAALLLAPAAPALVPGCTAKASMAGAPTWIFFTRPSAPCRGSAGVDGHALAELNRLIASVPRGGRIDGHIFSISVDSVAKALHDAQKNGVDVWISTDGQVGKSKDVSKTIYLDALKHVVYCGGNRACIATHQSAISHTKLFVFSHATQPDGTPATDVVWVGSANQTYQSGMKVFNNTVTIYGAEGLYADLRHYLDDLYQQKQTSDYYRPSSGRGHIMRKSANVYVSPEKDTDLINHRLDDLAPSAGCQVRVMQASIRDSRLAIVNRLVKIKKGKCDVRITAHTVEREALSRLKAAGIPIRRGPIHDKAFIMYGKFGGSWKYRIYTGSHNLGYSAGRLFDEIFVKLAPESGASHPAYDAFMAHFDDAWNAGTPL